MRLTARTIMIALISAVLNSCSGSSDGSVAMHISALTSIGDTPIAIRLSGLAPSETVTVQALTTDSAGYRWTSHASFQATDQGTVDLGKASPISGSYSGPDVMGLFRSLTPESSQAVYYHMPTGGETVYLTVESAGKTLATQRVLRLWTASDVSTKRLQLSSDGFIGMYAAPPVTGGARPAVLIFGGSEGGLLTTLEANLLAAHGYPTLALAYFGLPGLPPHLVNIPLEYFARALAWLRRQPGVDPGRVFAYGYSRGGEAALMLAVDFPNLVHGVVAPVTSDAALAGIPADGVSVGSPAWTLHGQPVPFSNEGGIPQPLDNPAAVIPVSRIQGPIFLVCGGRDQLWDSCSYAREIQAELNSAKFSYPHPFLDFPLAGHLARLFPYYPGVDTTRDQMLYRTADELAREKAWPTLLEFLSARGDSP